MGDMIRVTCFLGVRSPRFFVVGGGKIFGVGQASCPRGMVMPCDRYGVTT